eukprot:TRINITY_DN1628_c0_g1_i1.p1 TRINITY_DN1628_c0_g1~~TRINITY_DN1628_c0_g1_i1.p1  ORF type:complete len:272 (+),score=42.53 TRINITY_DN1628_c0_g1_i1:67-882(+)
MFCVAKGPEYNLKDVLSRLDIPEFNVEVEDDDSSEDYDPLLPRKLSVKSIKDVLSRVDIPESKIEVKDDDSFGEYDPLLPRKLAVKSSKEKSTKSFNSGEPAIITFADHWNFFDVAVPDEWRGKTTVQIQNFPAEYSQCLLRAELDELGFEFTYDFLYVPVDPMTFYNTGCAFINFVDDRIACKFRTVFSENVEQWSWSGSVDITPSPLQGYADNLEHFQYVCMSGSDPELWPLFLHADDVMTVRFCQTCGGQVGGKSNFCHLCGSDLRDQ